MFRPDPKPEKRAKKSPQPLKRSFIKKKQRVNSEGKIQSHSDAISFADTWFSECIRLMDSDKSGNVKCFTCQELGRWTECDCGHYLRRSLMGTRYEVKNAKPQCKTCNQFNYGMQHDFGQALKALYGEEVLQELRKQSLLIVKYSIDELISIGNLYRAQSAALKKQKHL